MITEPASKNALAYFDGQNLFNSAKEAFGYPFPNYDPLKLAREVCIRQGWTLGGVYFYTGIPDQYQDKQRHAFWAAKLAVMGTRGIHSFTRPLRYQNKTVVLPNGNITTTMVGREKGIDVRIALDIVRHALEQRCDVALIFSQDQDLSEVAKEIRTIAKREQRWIKMASAFPSAQPAGTTGESMARIGSRSTARCTTPASIPPTTGPSKADLSPQSTQRVQRWFRRENSRLAEEQCSNPAVFSGTLLLWIAPPPLRPPFPFRDFRIFRS